MKEKEAESAIVALGSAGYPFVTVIVTYFNRFDLVKFTLEGLESQDYPPDRYEVILVDDGSTKPEAVEYLNQIEPHFLQLGWRIVHQENKYLGAARNFG